MLLSLFNGDEVWIVTRIGLPVHANCVKTAPSVSADYRSKRKNGRFFDEQTIEQPGYVVSRYILVDCESATN